METGLWHRDRYLNAFALSYLLGSLAIMGLLTVYRKHVSKQVNIVLLATLILSVTIVVIDNLNLGTKYLAFSFLLPLISVLVMLHSKPYDMITGAMGEEAFASYLTKVNKKKESLDIIVLQLSGDGSYTIPKKLGAEMHHFVQSVLKDSIIFNLRPRLYVALIEHSKNSLKR